MRRILRVAVLVVFLGVFLGNKVWAADYQIKSLASQISLEKDASLDIVETIQTNFLVAKHGIYRVIPYIYTNQGKTYKTDIEVVGVKDDKGTAIPYSVDNFEQSRRIKIGSASYTVIGNKNYIIEYRVKGAVLDYGKGPEIYWNVSGDKWEVPIEKVEAKVESPFGKITKVDCFGCKSSFTENEAQFLGGQNMTVVVQIDKNNQITMPSKLEKEAKSIFDNWGYLSAIMPFLIMFWAWYTRGRDKKYVSENVFYKPDEKSEVNTPLINRPHLPLVYGPIDNLSPAEVGTILDERVDTKDIVAEILELGKLGWLKIEKVENKGFLGIKTSDYQMSKLESNKKLNDYQTELLDDLFERGEVVKISELKNNFYVHLPKLKEKIYKSLADKKMTEGNLDKVKAKWIILATFLNVGGWVLMINFISQSGNMGPVPVVIVGGAISLFLATRMPRKTAWGYSLSRQAEGLKYYLSKGKWREEIAEKRLFLAEMLPLAVALGVVDKLAKEMKDLEVEAPEYFQGVVVGNLVSDLNNFSVSAASGMVSTPAGTGAGGWSGGSGFSGGSSGGGFGGGGGGSW